MFVFSLHSVIYIMYVEIVYVCECVCKWMGGCVCVCDCVGGVCMVCVIVSMCEYV